MLVLGMSPALAIFEAGMLRSKNALSTISQVMSGIMILSMMWLCFGYSLTFSNDYGGIIGDFKHGFFIGVDFFECSPYAPTIPHALFAVFQMMFCVISPLLVTGAYAERMKFRGSIFFSILWTIVIYYPVRLSPMLILRFFFSLVLQVAHWIWGHGFLYKMGVYDFAGGIVIHTTAGVSSLVVAWFLGPRRDFAEHHGEVQPHNIPLAAVGTALLWMGWFGFNGGSALASGGVAASALVSTQIGGVSGAFVWMVLCWIKEKPSLTGLMNGALAGLAGITPASGYISAPLSLLTGVILGAASFFGVSILKHRFHIDDALDVSQVHGLTGVIGSLAVGFFADKSLNPNGPNGAFFGNPKQIGIQLAGILICGVYAGVATYGILKFIEIFYPVRAKDIKEDVGLDWSEHHEVAYGDLFITEPRLKVAPYLVRMNSNPTIDDNTGSLQESKSDLRRPLVSVRDSAHEEIAL